MASFIWSSRTEDTNGWLKGKEESTIVPSGKATEVRVSLMGRVNFLGVIALLSVMMELGYMGAGVFQISSIIIEKLEWYIPWNYLRGKRGRTLTMSSWRKWLYMLMCLVVLLLMPIWEEPKIMQVHGRQKGGWMGMFRANMEVLVVETGWYLLGRSFAFCMYVWKVAWAHVFLRYKIFRNRKPRVCLKASQWPDIQSPSGLFWLPQYTISCSERLLGCCVPSPHQNQQNALSILAVIVEPMLCISYFACGQ